MAILRTCPKDLKVPAKLFKTMEWFGNVQHKLFGLANHWHRWNDNSRRDSTNEDGVPVGIFSGQHHQNWNDHLVNPGRRQLAQLSH